MGFGVGQSSVDSSQRWAQIDLQRRAQSEQERRTKEEEKSRRQQAEEAGAKDRRDSGENVRRFDVGQENNTRDFTESQHRFDTETSRRDAEFSRKSKLEDRAFSRQQRMDDANLQSMSFQDALNEQKWRKNEEELAAFRKLREEDDRQVQERKQIQQGALAEIIGAFLTTPDLGGESGYFLSPRQLSYIRGKPGFEGFLGAYGVKGPDGNPVLVTQFENPEGGDPVVFPIDNAMMAFTMEAKWGKDAWAAYSKQRGDDARNAQAVRQAETRAGQQEASARKADADRDARNGTADRNRAVSSAKALYDNVGREIRSLRYRQSEMSPIEKWGANKPKVDKTGKTVFTDAYKRNAEKLERLEMRRGVIEEVLEGFMGGGKDEGVSGQGVGDAPGPGVADASGRPPGTGGVPLLDEEYALLNPDDPKSKEIWERRDAETKREREAVLRRLPEEHRKAVEWALANPGDGRAKKILVRNGVK